MTPKDLKKFFQENIKLSSGWTKDVQLLYLEYCCKYNLSDKITAERQKNGTRPPSENQKNFIIDLGGDTEKPKTMEEARTYIKELLEK